jgi:hypothetical protein
LNFDIIFPSYNKGGKIMKTNTDSSLLIQAKEKFNGILEYIMGDAQGEQIHEVERNLFGSLLQLGKILLELFLERKGDGNVGATHRDEEGIERKLQSMRKEKVYFSVFGIVVIKRAYYWLKGKAGVCPLDAQLNLPQMRYSYILEEWAALMGVRGAYNKVVEVLSTILRIELWNRPVEEMMMRASEQVEEFYQEQPIPEAGSEGEILVATADGKGVPMKKKKGEGKTKGRLKKGEKRGKKKMSTVTAVYTIDKNERGVEDVVKEVIEADRAVKAQEEPKGVESKKDRPKPKNKVVKATLDGKEEAFKDLAKQVAERDPEGKKKRVALVDGEHKLRDLIKTYLEGFCIILDLFHVLEYLWKASHVFNKEGSKAAELWVTQRLRMLLTGKVVAVIEELKDALKGGKLSKAKREALEKVIVYLQNGQEYMRYDEYLAQGYPIGSGVIEGACRNLVKDRMEMTGMRWCIEGAEAVLQMRSVDVNGLWKKFWDFRAKEMRKILHKDYAPKAANVEEQAIAA